MNKHDELTVAARDMAGQENCDGPEYDMIIELTDLLQQYGDALVRLGDMNAWSMTTCQGEFEDRARYAQTTVEAIPRYINGGDLTADPLRGFSFTYDGVSIEIPPSNDPESFYLAVRCAMQALIPEPPEDK